MAGFSRLQFVFLFFLVASMSTIQVSLAGGEGSLTKDQCPAACAKRCSATSHLNNCLMFCNLCCNKCLCAHMATRRNVHVTTTGKQRREGLNALNSRTSNLIYDGIRCEHLFVGTDVVSGTSVHPSFFRNFDKVCLGNNCRKIYIIYTIGNIVHFVPAKEISKFPGIDRSNHLPVSFILIQSRSIFMEKTS
ncbi:hypothetical protein HYC85_007607 [Camellia sinensis]|uniref:Uncharacterized protein n=1 Tax=Camellia sinensis TaxID=4442 RepID=A0A7J7HRA6_CAMSI|nr:hypothetical protein HYC85_007607 [Camellia sinensis]